MTLFQKETPCSIFGTGSPRWMVQKWNKLPQCAHVVMGQEPCPLNTKALSLSVIVHQSVNRVIVLHTHTHVCVCVCVQYYHTMYISSTVSGGWNVIPQCMQPIVQSLATGAHQHCPAHWCFLCRQLQTQFRCTFNTFIVFKTSIFFIKTYLKLCAHPWGLQPRPWWSEFCT